MSLPPPPNPYGGPQPYGGQPQYAGQPQWGGQQPGAGEGQFSGPPPWGPPRQQPQWGGPPPGPPPSKGGRGKWIFGGGIVLLVVALAVTVTILVTRDGSNENSPTPPRDRQASEFASANDTGPVNIITEDPTCDAWGRVGREYSAELESIEWPRRDRSLSAGAWTPQQKTMYDNAGKALNKAADQAASLSKRTPHRVMRELYAQFSAYTKFFSIRIPEYVSADDDVLAVSDAVGSAISNICSSIEFGSAAALAPLVTPPAAPTVIGSASDAASPKRFIEEPNSVCSDWQEAAERFSADTAQWLAIDANIPASDWTPEQRSINEAVGPTMRASAGDLDQLSRRSSNPVFEDFGVLAAQYRLAYALSLPSYTAADGYLSQSSAFLVKTIVWACKASG